MVTFLSTISDATTALLSTDFVPLFFRAWGTIALMPLSPGSISAFPRLLIAGGVTMTLASFSPVSSPSLDILLLEFLFGMVLSAPLAFTLGAAEMCGELFDYGRGQTAASSYAPLNDSIVSLMAGLFFYRWWIAVLVSGYFLQLIVFLGISTGVSPPGSLRVSSLYLLGREWFSLGASIAHGALSVAAPLLLLFLLIEGFGALTARILPAYSLTSELLLVKSILGILALILLEQSGIISEVIPAPAYVMES